MMKRYFSRDFLLLFLGNAVSQLGDGAGYIALMWWVAAQTGSAMLLGLMAVCRTVAGIIMSPLAGATADRYSKKLIVILMDLVRAAAYTTMAYLAYTKQMNVPTLVSLAVLNSVAAEFFQPATQSSIPLLVAKEELARANSLMGITGNIVSIVSYGAGGMLAAFIGVPALLLIDAISFAGCAVAETFVTIPAVAREGGEKKSSFFEDIKEGVQYVRTNKVLLEVMKVAAVLNLFAAPIFMLMPKFVQHDLGGSSSFYGYVLSAQALGVLLASVLISTTKVVERNTWLVSHGITLDAVVTLAFALLPASLNPVRIPILMVSGFFNGVVNIYFGVVMQRATAPEQLGRSFGLLSAVCMALQPLSQGAAGFLGDKVPLTAMYAVCAACFGLMGMRFATIPGLSRFLGTEQAPGTATEPVTAGPGKA